MNKKLIIGLIVIAIVAIGGFLLIRSSGQYGTTTPATQPEETQPTQTIPPAETTEPTTTKEFEPMTLSMDAGNFFFSPKTISAKNGQKITVNLSVSGTHTFTIDELGINESLSSGSKTVEFTPTKSGTFEYYCAIPGHREGGMFGSLLVQ